VKTPVFSFASTRSSTVFAAVCSTYSRISSSCGEPWASRSTIGCSGATTKNVAP
jgi:hypothetical protein